MALDLISFRHKVMSTNVVHHMNQIIYLNNIPDQELFEAALHLFPVCHPLPLPKAVEMPRKVMQVGLINSNALSSGSTTQTDATETVSSVYVLHYRILHVLTSGLSLCTDCIIFVGV